MNRARRFPTMLLFGLIVLLASGPFAFAAPPNTLTSTTSPTPTPPLCSTKASLCGTVAADPFNDRLAIQVGTDGRFNIGAFPNTSGGATPGVSWDMTFRWPLAPWSSFTTVRIDGVDAIYGSAGTLLQAPTDIDARTNQSRWQIGDIVVTQILQLAQNNQTGKQDAAQIAYHIRNMGSADHIVGVRAMIDTEINNNDGSPFRIAGQPGNESITTETEFVGASVPDTFATFFSVTDPTHVAVGTLKSGGATPPDRLVFASWPRIHDVDTPYDYTIDPSVSFGPDGSEDSAYALYWNPTTLTAGSERTITTFYGLAEVSADLRPPLAITVNAPATLSVTDGHYSPEVFDVVATIENIGDAPAPSAQATLLLTGTPGLTLVDLTSQIHNITSIEPGGQIQVTWRVRANAHAANTTISYAVLLVAPIQELKTVVRQITLPALPDADGDGLFDTWETQGVPFLDTEGHEQILDLAAMGADPWHKDMFVEIDYMGSDCTLGIICDHDHRPDPDALQLVIDAFQGAPVTNPDGSSGIALHVDASPESIMNPRTGARWDGLSRADALPHQTEIGLQPHVNLGPLTPLDAPWVWHDYFTPERRSVFHYAMFVHQLEGSLTGSGASPVQVGLPSYSVVSLGGWEDSRGSTLEQAGTFMHEFGHLLGLDHGGPNGSPTGALNFKPNYFSVMNYAFQMGSLMREIPPTPGGTYYPVIDFAAETQPTLDEANLDEIITLNGPFSFGQYWCTTVIRRETLGGWQGMDWNCNGVMTDSGVAASVNQDPEIPSSADSALDILIGPRDWAHLDYHGGPAGTIGRPIPHYPIFGDASSASSHVEVGITREDNNALPYAFRVTASAPGIIRVPAGTTITYPLTVTNSGFMTDTFHLTAQTSADWTDVGLLPATLTLSPNDSRVFSINVAVPATTSPSTTMDIKIQARGTVGAGYFDNALTRIVVTAPTQCSFYPIAIQGSAFTNLPVGAEIANLSFKDGRGAVGWLSWNGDQDNPSLVAGLTPPGTSTTYRNPDNPADHVLSVGDMVYGRPGSNNSSSVRIAMDGLLGRTITIPLWDRTMGNGAKQRYHIVGFAQVQIISYDLGGHGRLSVRYLGTGTCAP